MAENFEEAKKVEKQILTLVGNPRVDDNNTMNVGNKLFFVEQTYRKITQ